MFVFETETGSRYEVDTTNKRIRRTQGSALPTERQGPDNVWKEYFALGRMLGGYFIDWDGEGHGTLTSRVVQEGQVALS